MTSPPTGSSDDMPSRDENDAFETDDLGQYLQMYLDETDEQLDDLVETMLTLEAKPSDEASLNAAFRLLHSMKGAAGMMGFDQITVLTHHLETRFERLRSGRLELDRSTTNLTLRCIDFLRECNGRLRDGNQLSAPDQLLSELHELEDQAEREHQAELASGESDGSDGSVAESQDELPRDSSETPESIPRKPVDPVRLLDEGTDYHVVVIFEKHLMIKDIKARAVISKLSQLGEIKATRPEMDEQDAIAEADALDVILNTVHGVDQILEHGLLDGVQQVDVRVPRDPDAEPIASSANRTRQERASGEGVDHTETKSGGQIIEAPAASERRPAEMTPSGASKINETMRVDIDRLDSLMNLAGELIVNRAQFMQVASEISPGLRKMNASNRTRDFCKALHETIGRLEQKPKQSKDQSDRLGAIILELRSGLELISQQAELWDQSRRCFGRLDEAIDQLSRVSDSIQRSVLGTRMIPVGPLFNRFRRVVRDLTQERDKKVDFHIEGESTELDKRMIDALGDPLVHLVRNSIDHGLESPERRLAAGKSPVGRIELAARHSGNLVSITVRDDGGGIDAEKIRKRLIDKSLLSASEASALSDDQAVEYIWHPGFSTADQVTDISGRGVGMDVVKSRIQELNGSLDVATTSGQGTTFTLKLPLTLAIISSLLVRIRGITFAIPMDDVREIVSIKSHEIMDLHGNKTFSVRGEYLPLLSIDEILDWKMRAAETVHKGNEAFTDIVVLQSGSETMGLKIEFSVGSQDVVIKSLVENFVAIDGLAGASILGNGSVALMLDVSELMKMAIHQPRRGLV